MGRVQTRVSSNSLNILFSWFNGIDKQTSIFNYRPDGIKQLSLPEVNLIGTYIVQARETLYALKGHACKFSKITMKQGARGEIISK